MSKNNQVTSKCKNCNTTNSRYASNNFISQNELQDDLANELLLPRNNNITTTTSNVTTSENDSVVVNSDETSVTSSATSTSTNNNQLNKILSVILAQPV